MRMSGHSSNISKLPPHTGPQLQFIEEQPSFNKVSRTEFTYVFPVSAYCPAFFQPGPVYRGGEAAQIGHQSWNFSQIWTAYSTPKQMDWAYKPGYRGTQSAASFQVAQQAMFQMLQMRSINSAG